MPNPNLRFLLLSLAVAATLNAAGAPAAPSLNDALAGGKVSLSARLRWENADQASLLAANAFTLRTALGFTTAPVAGLQAMVEAENVASLGDTDNYNAAGTNAGGAGHTVIADPPVTDVNQAWLSYTGAGATFKAGRQRLVLDNARFVGDSGWRQNMQTFDAATLTVQPAKDFTLLYGYVWRASRVYGNQSPQPDFRGDTHLFNAGYSGCPFGKLTAYAYLLDFDNSAANSSHTFGASFAGAAPVAGELKATYRAEYATQQDAGNNPVGYRADYYLLELGGTIKALNFGAGYEVLGSDGGRKGFATPLATLHAFNGWADLFLATPAKGLRDSYFSLGATLPGGCPLKLVYHEYTSDAGRTDYGHEWDALLSRKIGKQWTVLAKAARYHGAATFASLTRFWLQAEFTL